MTTSSNDGQGGSGINNLNDLIRMQRSQYIKVIPKYKHWPCPFCIIKSKTKIQCIIHIKKDHPNIFSADKRLLSEFAYLEESINSKREENCQPSQDLSNESTETQKTQDDVQTEEIVCDKSVYDTKCDICKQYCKGQRGLAIHHSKKHKTQRRQDIVDTYVKSNKTKITEDIDPCEEQNEQNCTNENEERKLKEQNELKTFWNTMENSFEEILCLNTPNVEMCENLVSIVVDKLKDMQEKLPGPKNPMSKYFKMRKSKNFQNTNRKYKQGSNPQRQTRRDKQRREQNHHRDWIQWLYYNQRKRAVREISNEKSEQCSIPLETLYEKFQERWGVPNNKVIPQDPIPSNVQELLDNEYDNTITKENIYAAIKKTENDSAPGPDYIIPRTMKVNAHLIAPTIAKLGTFMLKWNYVPKSFKIARTILLYKGNDKNDVKNWRPITICSLLRRIIEKVLDKHLRSYLIVNLTQKGFTNDPGTYINTAILSAALNHAKANKKTLVAVLLDIRQAYDKIGYAQETMSMNAQPLPSKLRSLALELDNGNCTQIRTKEGTTKKIYFHCGLLQGAPTSPQKFNASTKPVLDELNEKEICRKYGYSINNDLDPITTLAFADDTGNLGNSRESASFLVYETSKNFNKIGLEINFEKSVAIIIENGKLSTADLVVDENITIRALAKDETIKYLGVTFAEEITLDHQQIIQDLNEKLNKIVSTVTLRPDQKLKIINMYIFPTIVYPFQTAPIKKLTKKFLEDVDKIIRHAVKEILNLPDDTPNSMLYSSNSMKGLSIIRAEWEAFIQNINTVIALIKVNHPVISSVRDLDKDIKTGLTKLKLPPNFLENASNQKMKHSQLLRNELRQREYIEWQRLRSKGKGVELFQDCPKLNRLLFEKHSITTSEWINYFKMVGNVAAVRNTPGRSSGTNRCRINSCDEIETLPHVLGFCHQGELLRHERHNKVVQILGNALRTKKWKVIVEFACLSVDGSNRRVDLIVYDETTRNGFILDPTVRFEINQDQPDEVHNEKKSIYEPCIPDIQAKCKLKNIEVIGLLVGARGTIPKFFMDFCKRFKIEKAVIEEIGIEVLRGSSRILSNHLYDPQRC